MDLYLELKTSFGLLQVFLTFGLLEKEIICTKCNNNVAKIIENHNFLMYKDFMYYECSRYSCRFRINAKDKLPYAIPRNFNLEHFASILFKYFPEGLNAGEIVIRLFHDWRLITSKKTVQEILS